MNTPHKLGGAFYMLINVKLKQKWRLFFFKSLYLVWFSCRVRTNALRGGIRNTAGDYGYWGAVTILKWSRCNSINPGNLANDSQRYLPPVGAVYTLFAVKRPSNATKCKRNGQSARHHPTSRWCQLKPPVPSHRPRPIPPLCFASNP
mmetsp:Transcript_9165/g.14890  ORF Transcript_9165/g.14890 Transcript_9165/m.14890 type:complete len:147 (-) Transcript_9165:302-742(-)